MKKQLIKSTSGIRGVIGNGMDPILATTYGAVFGTFLKGGRVVIGRDSRLSGEMIKQAVISGLLSVGCDVVDIDMVPTPTVEIAVKGLAARGGICVTASHNPAPWNALKFFNDTGEFITPTQYRKLNKILESGRFDFKPVAELGKYFTDDTWVDKHVRKTLALRTLAKPAIKKRRFKVVLDAINGAGSFAVPLLLDRLGAKVVRMNCLGNGDFVHDPEPKPANLAQLSRAVKKHKAHLGLAVDPDADRLALVDDKGNPVNEEYTLTIAVQEVLRSISGPTVINLSTSRATADVAKAAGSKVYRSKVGEANVVDLMHKKKAVIGGEGNGGVIYPGFHAGRDSLVAVALVLSALARTKFTLSQLVETLPRHHIIKTKASLPDNFDTRLKAFERQADKLLGRCKIDRRDGLRFDFKQGWLQLRKSNTEPIYRVIVETADEASAKALLKSVVKFFKS